MILKQTINISKDKQFLQIKKELIEVYQRLISMKMLPFNEVWWQIHDILRPYKISVQWKNEDKFVDSNSIVYGNTCTFDGSIQLEYNKNLIVKWAKSGILKQQLGLLIKHTILTIAHELVHQRQIINKSDKKRPIYILKYIASKNYNYILDRHEIEARANSIIQHLLYYNFSKSQILDAIVLGIKFIFELTKQKNDSEIEDDLNVIYSAFISNQSDEKTKISNKERLQNIKATKFLYKKLYQIAMEL